MLDIYTVNTPAEPLQTLTLEEVREAARKAYDEERLLAQHGGHYGYLNDGYVCVIGAALKEPQKFPQQMGITNLVKYGWLKVDANEVCQMSVLQDRHDKWLSSVNDERGDADASEAEFLQALNDG